MYRHVFNNISQKNQLKLFLTKWVISPKLRTKWCINSINFYNPNGIQLQLPSNGHTMRFRLLNGLTIDMKRKRKIPNNVAISKLLIHNYYKSLVWWIVDFKLQYYYLIRIFYSGKIKSKRKANMSLDTNDGTVCLKFPLYTGQSYNLFRRFLQSGCHTISHVSRLTCKRT